MLHCIVFFIYCTTLIVIDSIKQNNTVINVVYCNTATLSKAAQYIVMYSTSKSMECYAKQRRNYSLVAWL